MVGGVERKVAGVRALRPWARLLTLEDGSRWVFRTPHARDGELVETYSAARIPAGAEFTVEVEYDGSPVPRRTRWGTLGWEELTDGVIVASQPSGAPTWFPCNDRPSDKAAYRIRVTTACAAINVVSAAAPVNHAVSAAVAVLPTTAPTATAVTQSNGVNSAIARRWVKRNAAAAVMKSVNALTAAHGA